MRNATAPGWATEEIAERQQDRAGTVQSGIDDGTPIEESGVTGEQGRRSGVVGGHEDFG